MQNTIAQNTRSLYPSKIDNDLEGVKKWQKQNKDSAIAVYGLLANQSIAIGYRKGAMHSYWQLGLQQMRSGKYRKAESAFLKSIRYLDTFKNCDTTALIFTHLGDVYVSLSEYQQATSTYLKALAHAHRCGNQEQQISYINNNLGVVLGNMKQLELSEQYFQKAMHYAIDAKDSMLLATIYNNMGNVAYTSNNLERGKQLYKKSIQIKRNIKAYRDLYGSIINMGHIYLKNDSLDNALVLFEEALNISKIHELPHREQYAISLAIGEILLKQGKLQLAEMALLDVLTNRQNITANNELTLIKQLAKLYQNKRDFKKSNAFLNEYMILKEKLEGADVALKVSELETQYRTAEKDKEIAQNKLAISEKDKSIIYQRFWIFGITSIATLLAIAALWYNQYRNRKIKSEKAIDKLKARIEGEEKERERMAHELHDGVSSQLAAAKILIHKLKMNTDYDHNTIVRMDEVVEATSKEVRKVAHNLAPDELILNGLKESIQTFCNQLIESRGIVTDLQVYDDFNNLDLALQLNIYRIVQELVHNIVKHSNAKTATILLFRDENQIVLNVEDDGKGFTLNKQLKGLGLRSIEDRIKAYSGHLQIDSSEGTGTHIQILMKVK